MTRTETDHWRLGGIVLDDHPGPETAVTPGADADLEVFVSPQSDPPDETPDAWPDHVERHRSLLDYGARAGQYEPHEVGGGRLGYTETHDGAVPDGTLVVATRPPDGRPLTRGGWWIVDEVEGGIVRSRGVCRATFSLTFLAPLAQSAADRGYQTRTELAFDLEADTLSKT